jgi:hypothetical protein
MAGDNGKIKNGKMGDDGKMIACFNRHFHSHRFDKIIRGGLKSAIVAHGDITMTNLEPAVKRIHSQTWSSLKEAIRLALLDGIDCIEAKNNDN